MYILTGSQNLQLMEAVDQSLAGRVGLLHLLPFSRQEMKDGSIFPESTDAKLLNGCYPRLYDKGISPIDYYPNYIKTYVERDVRNIKTSPTSANSPDFLNFARQEPDSF